MTIEHAEYAKWVKLKRKPMAEYSLVVDKTLSEGAARGFHQLPVSHVEDIVNAGQLTKLELTELNASLYKEQKDIEFQIAEFAMKLALEYSKLELAIYKQEVLDALALERAQMEHDFKIQQADIERLKAENNARRAILIRSEADQKAEITDYKIRQEEAKRLGLDKELELLEAKKITAIERLKVIDALKTVIAAEELIVEAERRKAEALELVIAAERILLEIKETMIPLYENLADHKKDQAQAIIDEAAVKELIIRLGYDRIDVREAEVAADVAQKVAELDLEYSKTLYVRASNANDEARSDGSAVLASVRNDTTDSVIVLREALKQSVVDLRLDTQLERFLRDIEHDITLQLAENQSIADKLTAQLLSMTEIAESQSTRIIRCANTSTRTTMCKHVNHYVNSD